MCVRESGKTLNTLSAFSATPGSHVGDEGLQPRRGLLQRKDFFLLTVTHTHTHRSHCNIPTSARSLSAHFIRRSKVPEADEGGRPDLLELQRDLQGARRKAAERGRLKVGRGQRG